MEMKINCGANSQGNVLPATLPHFKNVKKPTMSQTFQHLNRLISGKAPQEFKNLSELVSSDIPLTLFETNLQLFLIDSFHLENEVLRILLSQNDYQIKRILGCKWFFQNLSFDSCATQLFPSVSVSLRCKIINRLSKHLRSAEEAEKYFVFVRNNYGTERAEYLLPKCRPEFILDYVNKVIPMFDHNTGLRILLNICKRHVEVGMHILLSIFEVKKEFKHELYNYKKILLYFASSHPDLVVPFLIKYSSYLPSDIFGKKLTKKLKSRVKEHLFTDFMKNLIFKEKHLFSILSFEEKVKMIAGIVIYKFEELTFNSWRGSSYKLSNLVKVAPKKDRLSLVESAFKEVYNLNYTDHANCWSSEILELVPTNNRLPYVLKLQRILETEESDRGENERNVSFDAECPEELFYLYDSRTAFEKFKGIIRKTPSVGRRKSILSYMVRNCSINNDVEVLEELIEFVVVHHRNDDPNIVYKFISLVCEDFSANSLNLNIYKKLEDVMHFFVLKNHEDPGVCNMVREKHMYYLLENNMSVESHVENFFESVASKREFFGTFVRNFKSKYSKILILTYCEKALQWISVKTLTDVLLMSLLDTCKNYNNWNKHNRIFLKDIPGLDEILKAKLMEKYPDVGAENWPLDVFEKYSFDVLGAYHKLTYLFYALKRNPYIIDQHLEGVLAMLFSSNNYNLSKNSLADFIKMASFFEKTAKIKEITLDKFKNGDSIITRKNALNFYSYICTIEEFNKVIEEYLPKQEKVQVQSDPSFDEIQILIPTLIKNIRPRWKNLQLIVKFFLGDFLEAVLPSLRSCCYYTKYEYVMSFLKELLEAVSQKISYRKHIIRLILELSDRESKFNFFLKCWDEYKHYSIRSLLLLHIKNTFLEVQSEKSFKILEKCILDCDTQIIESRPSLEKIPKKFWTDYVSVLWRFSENQKRFFRSQFREAILSCFNRENISSLSPELCESIIKDNLFSSSSELFNINNFTVSYLVADSKAVECRVQMVLELIKDRKPNASSFRQFVNILILTSLENPEKKFVRKNFAELLKIFLDNWPEYPNGILFEERILLTYYFLYHKVLKECSDSNTVPVEFGKELKKLYSDVDGLSDLCVIYAETLNKFFNNFKTLRALLTIRQLIQGSQDRTLAVLAILSVPEEALNWHIKEGKVFDHVIIEGKNVLNDIVKTLESYNDRVVEIYLRWKIDFVK